MGQVSLFHSGTMVSFDIEPFTNYGQHATDSAYPHADSLLPVSLPLDSATPNKSNVERRQLNLYVAWIHSAEDEWWYARIRQALATLKQVARAEGIYNDTFPAYPNYALSNTTAEGLYGAQNAARLRVIRNQIDPERVMDLAGGFEI